MQCIPGARRKRAGGQRPRGARPGPGDRARARRGLAQRGDRRRAARCMMRGGGSSAPARRRPRGVRSSTSSSLPAGAFDADGYWVAAERFDELAAGASRFPSRRISGPERLRKAWTREDAARELVARPHGGAGAGRPRRALGRFAAGSPTPVRGRGHRPAALESEGRVLRGRFTSGADGPLEWCDRRLLARIHRYTLGPPARRDRAGQRRGAHALPAALAARRRGAARQGCGGPRRGDRAARWLRARRPGRGSATCCRARRATTSPRYIDMLCLSGRVAWGRVTPGASARRRCAARPSRCMVREHSGSGARRRRHRTRGPGVRSPRRVRRPARARRVVLPRARAGEGLLRAQVERALGELAGAGLVTADSFSGLRALLTPRTTQASRRVAAAPHGVDTAGRWALLGGGEDARRDDRVERSRARCSRATASSSARCSRASRGCRRGASSSRVYRRLEARGEIRGGRFVAGFGGEQFALPEAVGRLRAVRKLEKAGELVALRGADPLNLVGIVTPEARVPAIAGNRVLFRDGVADRGARGRRAAAAGAVGSRGRHAQNALLAAVGCARLRAEDRVAAPAARRRS